MLRFVPAAALFALTLGCGVSAGAYSDAIVRARSPQEAAPFVAPFSLFSVGAGASFCLAAASIADSVERRRRSR